MTKIEGKYDERNRFWTEQALNQFGYTSNFFFLISLGFFAFLFKYFKDPSFDIELVDRQKNLLVLAVTFAGISLITSAITVLSRLHDLRLTRHTIWIRKKSYDKFNHEYPDDDLDLDHYGLCKQLKNFFSTLWYRHYFIKDKDIKNEKTINKKFTELRLRNLLLARFSWRMMNSQFVALAISLIFYLLSSL